MAIIREISDSNLETGRNGSKSGVSQIMQESWQPCVYSQTPFFGHLLNKDTSLLQTVCFVPGERKSFQCDDISQGHLRTFSQPDTAPLTKNWACGPQRKLSYFSIG